MTETVDKHIESTTTPATTLLTDQYIQHEKLNNEEFKLWKKSVPLLYETIQTYVLDSPSLTVQSLPKYELSFDKNEIDINLLLGTFSSIYSTNSKEYLKHDIIRLPSTLSSNIHNSIPIEINSSISNKKKLRNIYKWELNSIQINKVRFNKSNNTIATSLLNGDIEIFKFDQSNPIITLKSDNNGKVNNALEWGINNDYLLSGGEDTNITLWDLSKSSTNYKKTIYETHDSIVNDVSWNHSITSLFGSVSDDLSIQFHDLRSSNKSIPLIKISNGHDDSINSIEFNPSLENLFVTGSSDNLIKVWDLRNVSNPIRILYGHTNSINNLKFNPSKGSTNLLASSSNDKRINIWDLNKLNIDYDESDYIKNENSDPSLIFIHGGHTGKINEFDWVENLENVIVSVGEDNLLQIWKPSLEDDEDEDEDDEEEEETQNQDQV
ncbi:hypothetical protein WICMUC_004056 [Wickerhamomyces mucosus]|uniref:Histone-binding protein RBBP4-like N-terminal domain-containing protein n=1 Tax=Wickerhamomyces mucosus TaxID=1378264 RepID=A0A9P8PK18_9ASCO|nr:hypothetical protein WICMUC_004056 [Wickerhamomyces mucosus]